LEKYTYSAKRSDNKENWCIIDAKDQVLGRLASQIAYRIRGKHNPLYTPHVDTGDWVIVVNADKVRLTGNKMGEKTYYRHSGYIGGIKSQTAKEMLEKKPEDVLKKAVRGMLPKNRLGNKIFKNLFVYAGSEHPHEAQKPRQIKLSDLK